MLNTNLHDDEILDMPMVEPTPSVATQILPPAPPREHLAEQHYSEDQYSEGQNSTEQQSEDQGEEEQQVQSEEQGEEEQQVSSIDNVIPPNIQKNLQQAKTKLNSFWLWGKKQGQEAFESEQAQRVRQSISQAHADFNESEFGKQVNEAGKKVVTGVCVAGEKVGEGALMAGSILYEGGEKAVAKVKDLDVESLKTKGNEVVDKAKNSAISLTKTVKGEFNTNT